MSAQRVLSDHAAAAKCIRQELKKAFPSTKFRVTSEVWNTFGRTIAIGVNWIDGVEWPAVCDFCEEYKNSNSLEWKILPMRRISHPEDSAFEEGLNNLMNNIGRTIKYGKKGISQINSHISVIT